MRVRACRTSLCSQGCSTPGMRRFDTEKPTEPGFGLGAAPGRAFVADFAAGAGGRARKRRDRGRVIVCFDLHHRVGHAFRRHTIAGARRRRLKHRSIVALDDRGVVSVRHHACPAGWPRGWRGSCRTVFVLRARRRSIQSALKILWRQCSEFACANIISSTSVGSRPSRRKARTR